MTLTGRECTPMPWINVMANAGFGFMVSAEGGGCTWSVNSQKNTLTPWSNDPGRIVPSPQTWRCATAAGSTKCK